MKDELAGGNVKMTKKLCWSAMMLRRFGGLGVAVRLNKASGAGENLLPPWNKNKP